MSFELEQKRKKDVIKETCNQRRCGSCGKLWNKYDEFEEFLSELINNNIFKTLSQLNALDIVLRTIKNEN
jgi:hypothetical protein